LLLLLLLLPLVAAGFAFSAKARRATFAFCTMDDTYPQAKGRNNP
jgi:hypothetical protein